MSYIPINPADLLNSPVFTGDPRAPTPSPGDSDNSLATTAFVTSAISSGGTYVDAPIDGSLYGRLNAGWTKAAPLASPALIGNPTAPTPTAGDSDTSIATTAFVVAAITASGGGGVPEAPNDGQQYARQSLNWSAVIGGGGGAPPATVAPIMDSGVTGTVGTTIKYAREDHVHPSDTSRATVAYVDSQDALKAPLASPTFTGDPKAPTPTTGDNDTSIATTAFVTAALSAAPGGYVQFEYMFDTATVEPPGSANVRFNNSSAAATTKIWVHDISSLGKDNANIFPLASVGTKFYIQDKDDASKYQTFTISGAVVDKGVYSEFPVTFLSGGSALSAARVFFVITGGGGGSAVTPSDTNPLMDGAVSPGVSALYARGDHRHPTDTSLAPLASPTFTGDPKAPTPTAGDNDTSIATTAFVMTAVAGGGGAPPATVVPIMDGVAAVGTTTKYAREDHVHPSDTSRAAVTYVDSQDALKAPLASPALTGNPTAPTPTAGDNDTSIATTAFVTTAVAAVPAAPGPATVAPLMDSTAAVGTTTKYAREDHVHPSDTTRAPLASPTFTGVPAAPTATVGTSTTQLATTAFVAGAVTAAGSISEAPSDGQYYSRRNVAWAISPGGLSDAPVDGTLYGRLNAVWTAVPAAVAPATVAPLIDSVAAVGTTTKYAREDHVHPLSYTAAALTRVDDTNVTLTLGGTPATALLKASSITAGWTGTLSTTRGGLGANNGAANGVPIFTTGAVTMTAPAALTRTNDTNVTMTLGGTPATALLVAASMTLGWTGTLATGRGGLGLDASASNGVPLFATGVATMTGTSGTGNFVRVTDPALLGNPTAPTPSPGDNDTSIATTAFVAAAITAAGAPAPATVAPIIDGTAAVGVATKYAREDHVHPLSYTAAALTKTDDTNVTLTLGGTPATALLKASSLTLGWTGTLSTTRGGLGLNAGASNGVPIFAAGSVTMTAAAALTRTNDTNVTLTLGGTPTTALLAASSLTMGWSGTLAPGRGGLGLDASASSGVPVFASGTATMTATTGTGNIARDSTVPLPATATPIIDSTGAVGSATKYAREDHVHPKSWTQLTQAAYDALSPPSAGMLYVVVG